MARVPKAVVISMLFGVGILFAFGFLWLSRPLPVVGLPALSDEDELSITDDPQVSKFDRYRWAKEVLELHFEVLEQHFKELPMGSDSFPYLESYRMVLLPSFDAPIMVRASRTADGFELTTKLLKGKGGFKIGKLSSNETRPMTEAEWQRLTKLLDHPSFWSMPTIAPTELPTVDGASWLVESRRRDVYHDVLRNSPKPKFLEACRYFLQLAGREEDYQGYWE
jgi:hypothetical protein